MTFALLVTLLRCSRPALAPYMPYRFSSTTTFLLNPSTWLNMSLEVRYNEVCCMCSPRLVWLHTSPEHVLRKIHQVLHISTKIGFFYTQNPSQILMTMVFLLFFSQCSITSPYFTYQLLSHQCLLLFPHSSSLQKSL